MTDKQFWAAYKDPRWQKRRLEILSRADWRCEACEETTKQLHVHHRHYVRGRKPWEYKDNELDALCETCHERATAATKTMKTLTGNMGRFEMEEIVGFAQGLLQRENGFHATILSDQEAKGFVLSPRNWEFTEPAAAEIAKHARRNGGRVEWDKAEAILIGVPWEKSKQEGKSGAH